MHTNLHSYDRLSVLSIFVWGMIVIVIEPMQVFCDCKARRLLEERISTLPAVRLYGIMKTNVAFVSINEYF